MLIQYLTVIMRLSGKTFSVIIIDNNYAQYSRFFRYIIILPVLFIEHLINSAPVGRAYIVFFSFNSILLTAVVNHHAFYLPLE